MRWMPLMLVLPATVGLAACGSSSHHAAATGASGTGAAHERHAAGTPLTRQQATALASAVNLTSVDVPGFTATVKHEGKTAAERRVEQDVRRCAGSAASHKTVVQISSKDFERHQSIAAQSVSSEVTVAATAAQAAGELAAVRSPHVRGCLAHYLEVLFKNQRAVGARVEHVSIMQGTPPAPGASGSFGWRMTAMFSVRGFAIPIYLDLLGFTYGPVEVSLVSTGLPEPLPAAIEERLFTLLVSRVEAYRPSPL